MEIWESMIARVVELMLGKVSRYMVDQDRNGDRFTLMADMNIVVQMERWGENNDLKNGNMGVWHGSIIRGGNEDGGA